MKAKLHVSPSLLLGILLIVSSIIILLVNLFFPILIAEVRMKNYSQPAQTTQPISSSPQDLNIVVPKFKIKSNVSVNVDPFDKKAYLEALSKGVAHAKGSSLPGQKGKIFIFAHSSSDIIQNNPYGTIFYPLGNLTNGDEILLNFGGKGYSYKVQNKLIVLPSEIQYLEDTSENQIVYLMTCWPPGTSLKRLIIIATPTPLIEV